jgi:HAD superfamily hydrolase (TIGR01490 family)
MLNINMMKSPKYAFFDVDDTVISAKSMFSFTELYFKQNPEDSLQKLFNDEINTLFKNDTDWKIVNSVYYSYFKHFPISKVSAVCQQWFLSHIEDRQQFYHQNVLQELRQHQIEGTECVFVSGSFRELLQPIADDLGVEHILSINLERDGLMFTGDILPPQTIGSGKADAVKAFLDSRQADAHNCFAYGDDISDVQMLEIVGKPRAVSGGRRLEAYALEMGWPIVQAN